MVNDLKRLAAAVLIRAYEDLENPTPRVGRPAQELKDAANEFFFGADSTLLEYWCQAAEVRIEHVREVARKRLEEKNDGTDSNPAPDSRDPLLLLTHTPAHWPSCETLVRFACANLR